MKKLLLVLVGGMMLTSCYTTKFTVGQGAQSHKSETYKQHNFVAGLVSVQNKDAQKHVNEAENADITVKHTFVDGLISGLTSGIYNPTTITIKEE